MKKPLIIHPLFFTIFPVLRLLNANSDMTPVRVIVVPLILLLCLTGILWLAQTFLIESREKRALYLSLFMLLSLSYLHFARTIEPVLGFLNCRVVRLLIWAFLLCLAGYLIKKLRSPIRLTQIFNATSVILVTVSVVSILLAHQRLRDVLPLQNSVHIHIELNNKILEPVPPDIYYIILDGYARGDVLKSIYNYDNTEFLDFLRNNGFYIAENSRSNYPQTVLSLASSLNITYLQDLIQESKTRFYSRIQMTYLMNHSQVAYILKRHGYRFVTFSVGVPHVEITNSDSFIITGHLSEFTNWLINCSVLVEFSWVRKLQYDIHRKSVLTTFNEISQAGKSNSPVFVMAHILTPHPPFIFGSQGEEKTPGRIFSFGDGHLNGGEEYRRDYRDQIAFTSSKIKETIDAILAKSSSSPIIILQGDHGPESTLNWEDPSNTSIWERTSILNAYYLPDGGNKWLYEKITPVNTFRGILSHYFDYNLELLEDKTFFCTWMKPFTFFDVTEQMDLLDISQVQDSNIGEAHSK